MDSPTVNPFYDRVKSLIRNKLPPGWRDWAVNSLPPPTAGLDRNRLRFALPSVDLALAWNPECKSISERDYKAMKVSLLSWNVGQALISHPTEFAAEFRPSRDCYVDFVENIKVLKPLILSREALNKCLASRNCSRSSEPPPAVSTPASGEIRSPDFEPLTPPLSIRQVSEKVVGLENKFDKFREEISALLTSALNRPRSPMDMEDFHGRSGYPPLASDDFSDSGSAYGIDSPTQPDPWGVEEDEEALGPSYDTSDFAPQTVELEPDVPDPPANLQEQLLQCQKLDRPSWCRVRYAEAENALKHGASFQPLLANFSLGCNNKDADFNLRKIERLLGIVSFGLLAQRDAFQKARVELVQALPQAGPLISKLFTDELAGFKKTSTDLLQYVCGKRAEVIQDRRKLLTPADPATKRALSMIPPSASHLFNEDLLSKVALPPAARTQPRFVHRKRKALGNPPGPFAGPKRNKTGPSSTPSFYSGPSANSRSEVHQRFVPRKADLGHSSGHRRFVNRPFPEKSYVKKRS